MPASWHNASGIAVQLVFDAALQYTEVYLNGVHLMDHRGGYTRFVVRQVKSINFKCGEHFWVYLGTSCIYCVTLLKEALIRRTRPWFDLGTFHRLASPPVTLC